MKKYKVKNENIKSKGLYIVSDFFHIKNPLLITIVKKTIVNDFMIFSEINAKFCILIPNKEGIQFTKSAANISVRNLP